MGIKRYYEGWDLENILESFGWAVLDDPSWWGCGDPSCCGSPPRIAIAPKTKKKIYITGEFYDERDLALILTGEWGFTDADNRGND